MAKAKKEPDLTVYYACKVKREGLIECVMPSDGCYVSRVPLNAVQELFRREGLSLFDGVEFQTTTKKKKTTVHFPLNEESARLPWAIALVAIKFSTLQIPHEILDDLDENLIESGVDRIHIQLDRIKPDSLSDESANKKESTQMSISIIDVEELDLEIVEAGNYAKLLRIDGKLHHNGDTVPLLIAETESPSEDKGISVSFF